MQNYFKMQLDELCARAIAIARSFADTFPASEVAADTLERSSLRRTLDGLKRNAGISGEDDIDVEVLNAVLNRELDRETVGWFTVFDGVIDPEIGAIGNEKDVRELTVRGQEIEALVEKLREISHLRSICRARLAAERLIMGR